MKSVRFVCLFAILVSMLVLAQSNRAPVVNQPNGLPIAQQRHPALPQNPSQTPHGAPFAQRGVGALGAPRRGAMPMQSGLDFATAAVYGSGGYTTTSVAVADVNGDGKPDLLVTNFCANSSCDSGGGVAVLLGNGDGTFKVAVGYASGGYASSVAVADVNGDGKPDLVVANNGGNTVGVLLGNGDGTFQAATTYASGGQLPNSVTVADVNGDGKPDLIVANQCVSNDSCRSGNDYAAGAVGVLLGNGDGTFQAAVSYGSGGYVSISVAVADVNGDGKPDVLVTNCGSDPTCSVPPGTVGILLGNGDGTFQTAVSYGSGGQLAVSVAAADVNGDGKLDLAVANDDSTVGVLLGNGDGTFQTAVTYGSGGTGDYSVAVADINGDGEPDLLVANEDNNSVGVLLGDGDGTFQTAVTFGSGGEETVAAAVADVNGDGKPDLVVANHCANFGCTNGSVGVLINTTLTPTTTALTSSQNPSNFGQSVTFTATVAAQKGFYKGTPTGTVSFYDGTTNIGNSNLNSSGVATLTTSSLSVGTHSMTATYNGDADFASSTSSVLYQVVQGAIVSLSPTSLNFGNQTVGITSSPQIVTLQNTGNINLTITSIQITGRNSSDFAETNNCPSSLTPNGSCKIRVTFTPTGTGTRNAAVTITDNAPDSPQSVPLTGVGVSPAVTFSPTSLTFPNQVVFTNSPAQKVTLTNTGAGVLTINHIGVTGQFSQTNNCPSSLNPNAYCTINVKFHPKNKGVQNGSVNVTDNAPGSPQQVPLTGTGTFVQFVPTNLHFGTQPVGKKSLPRKITLTNKGNSAVNITKISITGADEGDFAETNNCGHHVASGASCFIEVTFKPLEKGKRTADVSIYDDGGGSPQEVGLTGTGT